MNHVKKLVASLALSAILAGVGLASATACGGMTTIAPPPFDPIPGNPGNTVIGQRDPTGTPGDPFANDPNDPTRDPNDPANGSNPDANPPSAGIDEVIL